MPLALHPPFTTPPPHRRRLPLAALGLAAVFTIFGWGMVHLFQLRFAAGDVYAPYSTLRNGPLGAAAFYAALSAQPGLRVERNLRPLTDLGKERPGITLPGPATRTTSVLPAPPLTCFYLGADPYAWPFLFTRDEFDRLDAVLRAGGRVVVTFLPTRSAPTIRRLQLARDESAPSPGPGSPAPSPSPSSRSDRSARRVDLIQRWDIDFRRQDPDSPRSKRIAETDGLARPTSTAGLARPFSAPGTLSWHSVLDFRLSNTPGADDWRILYRRANRPVIVSRAFGSAGGELILASDSYFVSNEALRAEPRPALLARLVGPSSHLVFDETHLGVSEQPGLMTLARRYHLQEAMAALGLLAALFIWRNVSSLVPPPAAADLSAPVVIGRDSAAGFLNLLRRGVPPRDLIAACFAQWQRSLPGKAPADPSTLGRLRTLADEVGTTRRHSPAAVYRAMCEALRLKPK